MEKKRGEQGERRGKQWLRVLMDGEKICWVNAIELDENIKQQLYY